MEKASKTPVKRIDGVHYNADHAKKVGKEAFSSDKALQSHYDHLPTESDRKKALEAAYDQIVAPTPTPPTASTPAAPVGSKS